MWKKLTLSCFILLVTFNIACGADTLITGDLPGLLTTNEAGSLGIGTDFDFATTGNGLLYLTGEGINPTLRIEAFGNQTPFLALNQARGTQESPTASLANDFIGDIVALGHDGVTPDHSAEITMRARNNWSETDHSSFMDFFTVPSGSITQIVAMRLGFSGANDIFIPNGPLGIGTATIVNNVPLNVVGSNPRIRVTGDTFAGIGIFSNSVTSAIRNWQFVTNADIAGSMSVQVGVSQGADPSTSVMVLSKEGNVGVGTTSISSGQKLEVNGGMTLATITAQPTCSVTTRGTFWAVANGAGVKDQVEVCAKDAGDAYAWRVLY